MLLVKGDSRLLNQIRSVRKVPVHPIPKNDEESCEVTAVELKHLLYRAFQIL